MKKDKKDRSRKEVSKEVVAELYEQELRVKIRKLKLLPNDFRDLVIGGRGWESYAEIMGPRKRHEMMEWARGGVLCLAPLNEMERVIWDDQVHIEVRDLREWNWTWETFGSLVESAEARHLSFIYAPDFPRNAIEALNWVLSRCGMNIRFRAQLLSESGRPLGI